MATVTMRKLLEAGIHFGHQTRRWNPKMGRYIFGERHGIYIIDLQQTLRQLRKAYIAVRDMTAKGGSVLFVGTKKQARESVEREAERCGQFYVSNRWLGGTLTNWQTILKSIDMLVSLEEMETSGKIEQFKKKEATRMRKHHDKLEKNLSGIKTMNGLPAIVFVVDSNREAIAVREARRLDIPCIAVVDTNSDPDSVPIPIPGNDDAIRSIGLFCSIMADAAIEGRATFEKLRADEAEAAGSSGAPATSSTLAKQQSKYADDDAEPAPEEGAAPEAPDSIAAAEELQAVDAGLPAPSEDATLAADVAPEE